MADLPVTVDGLRQGRMAIAQTLPRARKGSSIMTLSDSRRNRVEIMGREMAHFSNIADKVLQSSNIAGSPLLLRAEGGLHESSPIS
ncbi:MAG: hypothetical protein JWQ56_3953 [Pseudarthrobacter sp.]|nr:hypothetical protein [Pseudarthrobacter sp.]